MPRRKNKKNNENRGQSTSTNVRSSSPQAKLSSIAAAAKRNNDDKDNESDADKPLEDTKNTDFPFRDCDRLFTAKNTLACAFGTRLLGKVLKKDVPCVPCAYKICCFDVAMDRDFCRQVPNCRSEVCIRAVPSDINRHRSDSVIETDDDIVVEPRSISRIYPGTLEALGYIPLPESVMRILIVGDGDYSFSLALARILCHEESDAILYKDPVSGVYEVTESRPKSASIVATSLEIPEDLENIYPGINDAWSELTIAGVKVCYEVDATRLRNTLPDRILEEIKVFDRIIWNFPCSVTLEGQDGQNEEMEINKQLIRDFVASAIPLLSEKGQIHMNHKTKPPFNQWKIDELVLEGFNAINQSANQRWPDFSYLGRVVLDKSLFHPYIPRKASDRRSFPVHDACTYVFGFKNHNDGTLASSDFEVTDITDVNISDDIMKDKESQALAFLKQSTGLIRVTPDLIRLVRQRHLDYLSMSKLSKSNKKRKAKQQEPKNKHKKNKK